MRKKQVTSWKTTDKESAFDIEGIAIAGTTKAGGP